MGKIEVFVIDNNALFRQGLGQALSQTEDIELVAGCDIDDEALELVAGFSPEIILLDINLPLLTGLNMGRQLTQRSPATSVIILTRQFNKEVQHLGLQRSYPKCIWRDDISS